MLIVLLSGGLAGLSRSFYWWIEKHDVKNGITKRVCDSVETTDVQRL